MVSRLGLSAALLCLSCDLAAGLTDVGGALTNPDAALLDRPGRKLASGRYHGLLVDGSLPDGGHVLAVRTDRDVSEIAIMPYLTGSPCYIENGVSADRLSSRIDVELPGVVSVQQGKDDSGRGLVSFVDFNCKPAYGEIQDTVIPQAAFPPADPKGLLSITADGTLYLVNAKAGKVQLIGEKISSARASNDTLWTLEGGTLVARDFSFKVLATLGEGVTNFVLTSGTALAVAYEDETGLHTWNRVDGESLLTGTGCAPSAFMMDTITYLDPCETKKLAIRTLGSNVGVTDEYVTLSGPEHVVFPERTLWSFGLGQRPSEFVFLVQEPGELDADLVLGTIEVDAEVGEGTMTLETQVLSAERATIRGSNLFVDWDGVKGTLVEQERDDNFSTTGLKSLATGVAQIVGDSAYASAGVLTDFNGITGTLKVLARGASAESAVVLAENVPIQQQTVEQESQQRVFVVNSKDGVIGDLYLTSAGNKVRSIARNVHVGTARFLEQPRGIAYLARAPGEDLAELYVWLIDSELTLKVHDKVSEYRTVPWPAAGILYAVPSGKDQGLWFAKAR